MNYNYFRHIEPIKNNLNIFTISHVYGVLFLKYTHSKKSKFPDLSQTWVKCRAIG